VISGMPDVDRICTSHIERQNHALRMHCRRLTRLTNAFSKKLGDFMAAVALNFCHYNFVKAHGAIRMAPAQAAVVESSAWTVAEMLEGWGEQARNEQKTEKNLLLAAIALFSCILLNVVLNIRMLIGFSSSNAASETLMIDNRPMLAELVITAIIFGIMFLIFKTQKKNL